MLIAAASLLSCTSNKDNTLAYFKDLSMAPSGSLPNPQGEYPICIAPDDELVISITSAVPEATAAYNLPMDNPATRSNLRTTTQPRTQTYIVDEQGYIMLPILGRMMVKGKTLSQISSEITARVAENVKDPYVRVDIVNFSVDVMGEVRTPQRVYSGHQHFTVLDALAQCGNYQRLNLNSSEVFNSPYFYLKQNDVVYVEPNQIRIDNSKYNQNNAFKLSVISTIVSTVSVIASLVIALTR